MGIQHARQHSVQALGAPPTGTAFVRHPQLYLTNGAIAVLHDWLVVRVIHQGVSAYL
jgi:hypothetical protein